MENTRIARLARETFLNRPLFKGFTDIRRKPSIRLRTILLSLFLMSFFGTKSLLSIDRLARTKRFKGLFGCTRPMVCSDTTFARVLRWLKLEECRAFLLQFLPQFEQKDLLRKRLCLQGKRRRLGILDGSYMGGHWLVTMCLPGLISYPVMVRRCKKQGEELTVARQMMREAERSLGKSTPELWLLDGLYFNKETIKIAREQHAHILIKFKDPEFREVTKDAQNLFDHFGGDEEVNGWDGNRTCRFAIRKTVATFASTPVQVIELREFYPKRKQEQHVVCWIVTTDLELSLEEVREAAHLRWRIENNVFKRISHLAGTKRFYFKDHRQFFNLLHIFFAAMAVLDCIIARLREHPCIFAALRAGIKDTWHNLFSQMQEVLYQMPCALAQVPQ